LGGQVPAYLLQLHAFVAVTGNDKMSLGQTLAHDGNDLGKKIGSLAENKPAETQKKTMSRQLWAFAHKLC